MKRIIKFFVTFFYKFKFLFKLGIVLNEWESVEKNTIKLREFVNTTKHKKVEFNKVASVLIMNTPEYSAKLLDTSLCV